MPLSRNEQYATDQAIETILHPEADWGPTVYAIEKFMVRCSELTGLGIGTNPPEVYWYRRPIIHLIEFIVYNLMVLVLFWLTTGYFTKVTRRMKVPRKAVRDSLFDKFIGVVFLMIWVSQLVFKALRPSALVQVWWLIMPCHLFTLGWSYILLTKKKGNERNRQFAVYLATVMTGCHWGPLAASAMPDMSDHQYLVESYVFILHHGMLCLMPFYWATRYVLLPADEDFFIHVTALATFVNVCPYTIVSYLTGLNVNYMLAPPRGMQKLLPDIFDSPFYRLNTIGGLIALTIILRMSISWVGIILRFLGRPLGFRRGADEPDDPTSGYATAKGRKPPQADSGETSPLTSRRTSTASPTASSARPAKRKEN